MPDPAPIPMQCMEIWGGNNAMDNTVSVPGIDAHVFTEPYGGDGHGGDIHYLSMCAAGNISRFVLADVSGHGDAVSDLAAALRRLMRKHINTVDQSRFAESLNEEFGRLADKGRFATAVLATYYAPTDHLIVCNAGHPPPLLYRASGGAWSTLVPESAGIECDARRVGVRNLPLGVVEPSGFSQFAVRLERGDAVVLYSDAPMEAKSPAGEQLGIGGLTGILGGLDPSDPRALSDGVIARVRAHRGGGEADDDQTLIVLHHNAADPPPHSIGERVRVLGRMLGIVGESGMPA